MTDFDLIPSGDLNIVFILGQISSKLDTALSELPDIKERLTSLERAADVNSGRISGAKLVFELLKILPAGVVGVLLGQNVNWL